MIANGRLQEFGFEHLDRLPKVLTNHQVTISLPSAIARQVEPATVVIERGIAIPLQMPGVPNGMIIKNDGTMVHVSHTQEGDFSSPLKVIYTDQIAYDVRLEAYNIMRRAVEVDRKLKPVWLEIQAQWLKWYPPFLKEIERQNTGQFASIKEAVQGLDALIHKFYSDIQRQFQHSAAIPLRIMVQTIEEMQKGWQGEEFLVDEILQTQYQQEALRLKLKKILKNPVFDPRSFFQVCYEPRLLPVIKLVVLGPTDGHTGSYASGIDLD